MIDLHLVFSILRVVQVDSRIAVAPLTEASVSGELADAEVVWLTLGITCLHSRVCWRLSTYGVELLGESSRAFVVVLGRLVNVTRIRIGRRAGDYVAQLFARYNLALHYGR